MGYSNNKWRKILTILMIINLCFILFAKVTKVFGSFTITNYTNNEVFNISDTFINKYPYYAFLTTSNGNYVWVICSNSPITTSATNPDTFAYYTYYNSNNTGMADFAGSYVYVQNTLNSSSLPNINTSYNTVSATSYGAMSVFYTNHDIKNKTSGDIIYNDNSYTPPNFDNISEIENGYPDGVFVSRGSYSANDYLYFHLLKITNTVPDGNQSTYYYDDKVFSLRKDTKYYRTYPADTEEKRSYYYITRSQLTLDTNSSYLYVLSNDSDPITTSYNILQPDVPAGIYDVIASDTAGVITEQEAINDKMANINDSQQEIENNSNNINNFLNENTVSSDTNGNINTSLNFNNNAPQFSSLFNSYFSRLTSIISDLGNYQDTDVITISIPIPFTNNTIPISSNFIFANQNNIFLKNLTTMLWYFIFGRYFLYFLINIYWLIANGQFFENYLTQKEVITGDML